MRPMQPLCSPACSTQPMITSSTSAGSALAALEQRVDDLRGQVDRMPARKPATAFAACRAGGGDDISFSHDTFFYRTTS